eukprot:c21732_g1_i1 orf=368-751(-)
MRREFRGLKREEQVFKQLKGIMQGQEHKFMCNRNDWTRDWAFERTLVHIFQRIPLVSAFPIPDRPNSLWGLEDSNAWWTSKMEQTWRLTVLEKWLRFWWRSIVGSLPTRNRLADWMQVSEFCPRCHA